MDPIAIGVSAREQMQWQQKLADTAHQREVADLKAAGLNPVLSAKLGGAAVPTGANDLSQMLATGAGGSGSASGSGGGLGGFAGEEGREGFLGMLIDSLPENGNLRLGKLSIPYSTIRFLYDQGAATFADMTAQLKDAGYDISLLGLYNAFTGKNQVNGYNAASNVPKDAYENHYGMDDEGWQSRGFSFSQAVSNAKNAAYVAKQKRLYRAQKLDEKMSRFFS